MLYVIDVHVIMVVAAVFIAFSFSLPISWRINFSCKVGNRARAILLLYTYNKTLLILRCLLALPSLPSFVWPAQLLRWNRNFSTTIANPCNIWLCKNITWKFIYWISTETVRDEETKRCWKSRETSGEKSGMEVAKLSEIGRPKQAHWALAKIATSLKVANHLHWLQRWASAQHLFVCV